MLIRLLLKSNIYRFDNSKFEAIPEIDPFYPKNYTSIPSPSHKEIDINKIIDENRIERLDCANISIIRPSSSYKTINNSLIVSIVIFEIVLIVIYEYL